MNKVVHFEIPGDDVDRTRSFYQEVFGWKIKVMPEMDYTIVTTGPTDEKGMTKEPGFINGGVMKRGDIKNPVITIEVDSIDAAAEKIVKHGGKVIKSKMEVGDMGYAAYFQDSEGNILGLWQSKRK